MDSRTGAFFSTSGSDATPMACGVIVLLALGGIMVLRKLKLSVNASV